MRVKSGRGAGRKAPEARQPARAKGDHKGLVAGRICTEGRKFLHHLT
jgi:hypothetical protein